MSREVWVIEDMSGELYPVTTPTASFVDEEDVPQLMQHERVVKYIPASAPPPAEVQGWVRCSERMPEIGSMVIVDGGAAYFSGTEWHTLIGERGRLIQWEVTHWMPWPKLPAPPEPEPK